MKPKERDISFILAACLAAGLLLTAACATESAQGSGGAIEESAQGSGEAIGESAQDSGAAIEESVQDSGGETALDDSSLSPVGEAIQMGTGAIDDAAATTDGSGTYYTPSDYIYFGMDGGTPIKWRVLDADKANDGTTDGMFLLSEYLLADSVQFEAAYDSDDGDGQGSQYNAWQGSDAQDWCGGFAGNTDNFSTAEQAAFLGVSKSDEAFSFINASGYSIGYGASSLTTEDKVFFLSAEELADYVGDYGGAPGLAATYAAAQGAGVWWLGSPYAYYASNAGAVFKDGDVYDYFVDLRLGGSPRF